MEGGIIWNGVLPGEADWDALLPNREWKHYGERTWEEVLQAPRPQLTGVLPESYDGSCGLQTYAECLNAWLRLQGHNDQLSVDLPRLLQLAAEKGVLTTQGSTMDDLANLVQNHGIPLQDDWYATGCRLHNRKSKPMPFRNSARTTEAAEAAIFYREMLCELLDVGPLVLCFDFDTHYTNARHALEPYCRRQKSWFKVSDTPWPWPRMGHCVTAYGYRCPGGDVRTLRLVYQENMVGAPSEEPGRGLLIHPDAVDHFHIIDINGLVVSDRPTQGYKPTPPKRWWEKLLTTSS